MSRKPTGLTLLAVSLVCILALAACNCAPILTNIVVTPATATIAINGTEQYTATGYYSNGAVFPNLSVTWSVGNSTVASITSGGLATGLAIGTSTVTATASGITSPAVTLTVNQLQSIAITPLNQTIAIGGTEQYTATGTFLGTGGTTSTSDVTSQVTWNAGSASVATFSTTTPGLATGVAGGTTTVNATLDGVTSNTTNLIVSGTVLVITPTVNPIAVGNSTSFTVVEQDGSTTNPPTYPITWTSSNPAVAGVVANGTSAGIAAGFTPGTTVITATEGSPTPIVGTLTVTVVAGTASFAYVSNSGTSAGPPVVPYSIGAYTVAAGTAPYLTSSATTTIPGASPSQTILNPNGQYMYIVVESSTTTIIGYSVNATTGAISNPTAPAPLDPSNGDPTFGLTDPYGRFLYVCTVYDSAFTNGAIYTYSINQTTGVLTQVGTGQGTNVNGCVGMSIDHTGSYLYSTNLNDPTNGIAAFSINQTTGALTPLATPTYPVGGPSSAPEFTALDPTGTYLFVANGDQTFTGYTIGTTGALSNEATIPPISAATALSSVVVTPSGANIYALDSGTTSTNGAVYGFGLASGVVGSAVSGTGAAVGNNPSDISIDPTGAILTINNVGNGTAASTISVVPVGSAGALSSATNVNAGISPYFVTFYNVP
jgi:trimeric autotransporter adhesin